jgi:hypothetical protein
MQVPNANNVEHFRRHLSSFETWISYGVVSQIYIFMFPLTNQTESATRFCKTCMTSLLLFVQSNMRCRTRHVDCPVRSAIAKVKVWWIFSLEISISKSYERKHGRCDACRLFHVVFCHVRWTPNRAASGVSNCLAFRWDRLYSQGSRL